MIDLIRQETKSIADNDDRSVFEIFTYITSELGELGEALGVEYGSSYKKVDEPAVVEAVDVIIGLMYLINKLAPELTDVEIDDIIKLKCNKWRSAISDKS